MRILLFLIFLLSISTNANSELLKINCTASTFFDENGNYNIDTNTKLSFDINLENKYIVMNKLEYSSLISEQFNRFFIIEKKENNIIYANNKFLNNEETREMVINSNIVARDYENEIQSEILSDTQLILREIFKTSKNNEVHINSIQETLDEFINLRTISNIYIFNRDGEVFLSFKDEDILNFTIPKYEIFEILDQNQVYIFQQNNNSISAYKKINFLDNIFLQVNRELNNNIWDHIAATKDGVNVLVSNKDMRDTLLEFNLDEKTLKYSFNNSKETRIFSNCKLIPPTK